MILNTYSVGQLQTNCYLLADEKSHDCLLIDPGDAADMLSEVIVRSDWNLREIYLTHGHYDHLLAAWELMKIFSCPVYIEKDDLFLAGKAGKSARYFSRNSVEPLIPDDSGWLSTFDGNSNQLDFGLVKINTPGHTPGSLSLTQENLKTIFTGDTIFAHGDIGRSDFSYSDSKLLSKSIAMLLNLDGDFIICPGHGPPSTISEERKFHQNLLK